MKKLRPSVMVTKPVTFYGYGYVLSLITRYMNVGFMLLKGNISLFHSCLMVFKRNSYVPKFPFIYLFLIICFSLHISPLQAQRSDIKKQLKTLNGFSESFEVLSQTVSPAVVQIISTGYLPTTGYPGTFLTKQRVGGSGVLLTPDGYIVTNAHVVEGAQRIQVQLPTPIESGPEWQSILKPRRDLLGAQVAGIDRETDLAVLKIEESNLPFLTLGNSDELQQGQLVFAFGSPLGLENSVSMGIVSSVARQLTQDDPMIYIQTDASINPGNSGGPLVNAQGEVVGINTFILSMSGGNEGLGFAAPSNIVRNVFRQLRDNGRVRRGEIGVYAQTVTPLLARGLNLPRSWGIVLADVYTSSPAEEAGLQIGDLVLTLDGKVMENGRQFDVNLYQRSIDDVAIVRILRGDETLNIPVVVKERRDDPNRLMDYVTPERNLIPKLGILGINLDTRITSILPHLRKNQGVVVAARGPETPYVEGGFLPGDVIYTVNEVTVTDLGTLREAMSGFQFGDAVAVQIERNGRLLYIAAEIE